MLDHLTLPMSKTLSFLYVFVMKTFNKSPYIIMYLEISGLRETRWQGHFNS